MGSNFHSQPHGCQGLCILSKFQLVPVKINLAGSVQTLQVHRSVYSILVYGAVHIGVKGCNAVFVLDHRPEKMLQLICGKWFQGFRISG